MATPDTPLKLDRRWQTLFNKGLDNDIKNKDMYEKDTNKDTENKHWCQSLTKLLRYWQNFVKQKDNNIKDAIDMRWKTNKHIFVEQMLTFRKLLY